MIRHRVHMIINADELERPISFRTDVLLPDRDPDRAYVQARGVVIDQDLLTNPQIMSMSAEMIEV